MEGRKFPRHLGYVYRPRNYRVRKHEANQEDYQVVIKPPSGNLGFIASFKTSSFNLCLELHIPLVRFALQLYTLGLYPTSGYREPGTTQAPTGGSHVIRSVLRQASLRPLPTNYNSHGFPHRGSFLVTIKVFESESTESDGGSRKRGEESSLGSTKSSNPSRMPPQKTYWDVHSAWPWSLLTPYTCFCAVQVWTRTLHLALG